MFARTVIPAAALVAGFLATQVVAFDINCNNNLVLYWGTNSYFNTHGGSAKEGQLTLKEYCASGAVDVVVLSFLDGVNPGSLPHIDIGWECDMTDPKHLFPGTNLAKCPEVASDIAFCQSKGAIVLLSIGGGAGNVALTKSDGEAFGQTLWDLFGGGSSNTRPFGKVKLDGFDLDIEGGDDSGYIDAFDKLRSLSKSDASKKYYLAAAPQCPYPGGGFMTNALPKAWFDLLWPQFYNNYCGLNAPAQYNFADWDGWAKNVSVNKDVRVYIGAPASTTAANTGYVDQDALGGFIDEAVKKYDSFGGVMFWDASQAWHNTAGGTNYAVATKNKLSSKGSCGGGGDKKPPPTPASTKPAGKTSATSATDTTSVTDTTDTTAATKKATTTKATPTSIPKEKKPCTAANNGYYVCVDAKSSPAYRQCFNGEWLSLNCSAGSVCSQAGDNVIYCV